MTDEEAKRQFIIFAILRIGGVMLFLLGVAIAFTDLLRPGGCVKVSPPSARQLRIWKPILVLPAFGRGRSSARISPRCASRALPKPVISARRISRGASSANWSSKSSAGSGSKRLPQPCSPRMAQ